MYTNVPKDVGVVLINGFSSNNSDYETLMPFFSNHHSMMIISLPGDPTDISLKDYMPFGEWLNFYNKAIAELKANTTQLVIVGFSIGAVPACYFADKHKADKLVLLSPIFNYSTFDDAATSVVRMVRSSLISKEKNDPLNSVKSFKHLGNFLRNPKLNVKSLFQVRVGPLLRPSNILLLPIYTLFEDEIKSIDAYTVKIANKIANSRMVEFDFTEQDIMFANTNDKKDLEMLNKDKLEQEKKFVNTVFRQLKRILPQDFKNLTYESVYNMMRLLAFCDRYTSMIQSRLLFIQGYLDKEIVSTSVNKILEKFPLDNKKIVSYPTEEHNLFSSKYYVDVAEDIIDFICKE
jgi:esterase/lipase